MDNFERVLGYFDRPLAMRLQEAGKGRHSNISEIRLRLGKPPVITVDSRLCTVKSEAINEWQLEQIVFRLCERSVYTHTHEMNEGYISLEGGNRAGVCGAMSGGELTRVTSVNIRIAGQRPGCADRLLSLLQNSAKSAVIAGSPCSGKTTVLRDVCRQLSTAGFSVAIVDERGEIAPSGFDLGAGCDVMSGCKKADGIIKLLRSMSPQIIAFDEIGTAEDAVAVNRSINCGAAIITTLHADSVASVKSRLQALEVDSALTENIFVLDRKRPGSIAEYAV